MNIFPFTSEYCVSATDGCEVAVVSKGYFIVFSKQLLFRDTTVKAEVRAESKYVHASLFSRHHANSLYIWLCVTVEAAILCNSEGCRIHSAPWLANLFHILKRRQFQIRLADCKCPHIIYTDS